MDMVYNMDMNKPTWLRDLESYVDAIPYGSVSIPNIERVNRRVTSVTTVGVETLRYQDNAECAKDILSFLTSLLDDKFTGDIDFGVTIKDGNISLLTIRNTKKTNY
jgi:hypothetical protein